MDDLALRDRRPTRRFSIFATTASHHYHHHLALSYASSAIVSPRWSFEFASIARDFTCQLARARALRDINWLSSLNATSRYCNKQFDLATAAAAVTNVAPINNRSRVSSSCECWCMCYMLLQVAFAGYYIAQMCLLIKVDANRFPSQRCVFDAGEERLGKRLNVEKMRRASSAA